jgi:hypothetical protein
MAQPSRCITSCRGEEGRQTKGSVCTAPGRHSTGNCKCRTGPRGSGLPDSLCPARLFLNEKTCLLYLTSLDPWATAGVFDMVKDERDGGPDWMLCLWNWRVWDK